MFTKMLFVHSKEKKRDLQNWVYYASFVDLRVFYTEICMLTKLLPVYWDN